MKFHAFSPRASATAVGIAVLLICGNAAGAMAAVTSTPAPAAPPVTTTTTATAAAVPDTPVPPGAPTGLTAVPGNGTVTLSWSAPSSDGGAPVDGYFIAGGTSPSSTSFTDRVRGTTVTMSHLANGITYFFRVSAENFTGDGPAVTVTVVIPPGPGSGSAPGAPAGLKVSSGGGFIALSWSPPASEGGSPVTGYHVYLGLSKSMVGARQFTTWGTSFQFTDAENGDLYYIEVAALNAAGEGPGTPETSVFVAPHATASPSGPSRPTGLTAQARRGEVVLSWSPPPGGLKDGQGYLIYMGTSPGHEGAKPSVPYLIQFTTHYTVAPLKNGTRYYFQVLLLDRDNQMSARSAEVSAVPGVGAGAAPGPAPGVGGGARPGGGKKAQPTAAPLPTAILDGHHTSPSPPAGLIVLLAALSLAGTGGAIAIVLVQRRRRRHGPGYAPVPAPRRPHDDQRSRPEELNGPRYR